MIATRIQAIQVLVLTRTSTPMSNNYSKKTTGQASSCYGNKVIRPCWPLDSPAAVVSIVSRSMRQVSALVTPLTSNSVLPVLQPELPTVANKHSITATGSQLSRNCLRIRLRRCQGAKKAEKSISTWNC